MRLLAALVCFALAAWSKSHVEEGKATHTLGLPVVVPPAAVVRALTLGYHGFGADLYWLKLLEYFGDKRYRGQKFDALVPMMDLVVTLDPKLCIVYRQAGLILTSSEITDIEAARRLLYRGLEQCPDDTYIPFILGFNLYFFEHRFSEAGEMLQRAARNPGAPEWLGDLALRVTAKQTDLPALETMLLVMAEGEQDERAREGIERRLKYLRTEMVLRQIDNAVTEAEKRGYVVDSLEQLVRLGLVPGNLADPSGGLLSVDKARGKSSTYDMRLELKDEALK